MTAALAPPGDRRVAPQAGEVAQADRMWALDDIAEGLRSGRYGGRPLEAEPSMALLLTLNALGWPVDGRALAAALPHYPVAFGLTELRETLMRLGYASVRRRMRWRRVRLGAAPALVRQRSGRISLVASDRNGRTRAFDPQTGAVRRIGWLAMVTVVAFRPDALADAAAGQPAGPTRLVDFLGAHRRDLALLLGLTAGINAVALAAAVGVRAIYEHVIPGGAVDTLNAIAVGVAGALVFDILLRRMKAAATAHVGGRIMTRVGVALFAKLVRLPLERLTGASTTAQLARVRQFEGAQATLTGPVAGFLVEAPFLIAMTLALYVIAGPLSLIPVAALALNAVILLALLPGYREREAAHAERRAAFQNLMLDASSNLSALRAYGMQGAWAARLADAADLAAAARRRAADRRRAAFLLAGAIPPAATAGAALLGATLVTQGALGVGALVGATILTGRAIAPIHQGFSVLWDLGSLRRTAAQVERFLQLPEAREPAQSTVSRRFRGALRASRVVFRYPGALDPALSGVDVAALEGGFVAITGASGAGKTTLLRVMAGLYAPQGGGVFVDGVNLRQLNRAELRGVVGFAPDDPPLFHGTVAQNLRLAQPTAPTARLSALCEELGLADGVAGMEDGLDTRLTHEAQARLPAGFRQMMGVAQALLTEPRVLLLDQPATALDPALEARLTEALIRRRGAMTIFMVTHRRRHMRLAQTELRLEAGRVAHVGAPLDPPPSRTGAAR